MLELPMSIKVNAKLDAQMSVETPLGDGVVRVQGPTDLDKDGDPEVHFTIDLPGTLADFKWKVEIPIGTFVGGSVPQIAAAGLKLAPDFPGKGVVIAAVEAVVATVRRMFFGK